MVEVLSGAIDVVMGIQDGEVGFYSRQGWRRCQPLLQRMCRAGPVALVGQIGRDEDLRTRLLSADMPFDLRGCGKSASGILTVLGVRSDLAPR
jgi:hypothetical protein